MEISFYPISGMAIGFFYWEADDIEPATLEILLFFFSITFSKS